MGPLSDVPNESCRPIDVVSECANGIVIALEMVEKNAKYVRNRSSFSK